MLANRTLTMLGDSVSTYLYLSLAHFLHSGDALKSWNSTAKGHAHPLYEQWWSVIGSGWNTARWWAWNAFYKATSADFHGDELCDCWRDVCFPHCSPQTFLGNRFFRFGRESIGSRKGRLFMVPWYGKALRPRWHRLDAERWQLECSADAPLARPTRGTRCPVGSPAATDLANASGASAILDAIAHEFRPDVMLIGMVSNWPLEREVAGLCTQKVCSREACGRCASPHKVGLCEFAAHYIPNGGDGYGDGRTRLWMDLSSGSWNFASPHTWRRVNATTPCPLPGRAGRELLVSTVIVRLLLLMRRATVFVDRVHFAPWVYHELNQLLLNEIYASGRE